MTDQPRCRPATGPRGADCLRVGSAGQENFRWKRKIAELPLCCLSGTGISRQFMFKRFSARCGDLLSVGGPAGCHTKTARKCLGEQVNERGNCTACQEEKLQVYCETEHTSLKLFVIVFDASVTAIHHPLFFADNGMSSYGGGGGGGFVAGQDSSQPGSAKKSRCCFGMRSFLTTYFDKLARLFLFSADKCLLPITIKQILNCSQDVPEDTVKIDGREASQITFVANIRSVTSSSTFMGYVMDDGTGQVNVNFWIEQASVLCLQRIEFLECDLMFC